MMTEIIRLFITNEFIDIDSFIYSLCFYERHNVFVKRVVAVIVYLLILQTLNWTTTSNHI